MSDEQVQAEEQIRSVIAQIAALYPGPLLTASEAAAIVRRKVGTIHNWSSQGRLDPCKPDPDGPLLIRDAFVRLYLTGGLKCGGRRGGGRRTRAVKLPDLP